MPNLVIDIGNTHSKYAVFQQRELLESGSVNEISTALLKQLLQKFAIKNTIVSSVGKHPEELIRHLKAETNYIAFTTEIETGITNRYKTPASLGSDRWAKVIAAFYLYPQTDCLIIDSGTCVTYDLLTAEGVYNGGSISPGIFMRFKALNHYTGRLPLVDWTREAEIPEGDTTENAIKSGVLQGYLNEVAGFITAYNNKYSGLNVLITGGDAEFLFAQLKNSIFAPQITKDPLLVLKGLNEVITLETCA